MIPIPGIKFCSIFLVIRIAPFANKTVCSTVVRNENIVLRRQCVCVANRTAFIQPSSIAIHRIGCLLIMDPKI